MYFLLKSQSLPALEPTGEGVARGHCFLKPPVFGRGYPIRESLGICGDYLSPQWETQAD